MAAKRKKAGKKKSSFQSHAGLKRLKTGETYYFQSNGGEMSLTVNEDCVELRSLDDVLVVLPKAYNSVRVGPVKPKITKEV